MSKIQLTNLPTAGSELFQGGEGFLTELKATEAHAIFGGKKHGKSGSGKSGSGSKKSRSGSGRGGYGCGCHYYNPCH